MRFGNTVAALSCMTIVFWRVIVVAINATWAIAHDRWVEASYWVGEDPLYRALAAVTTLFLPHDLAGTPRAFLVEIVAVITWSLFAFVIFVLLSQLELTKRLNRINIGWLQVIVLSMTAVSGAYLGCRFRASVPQLFHVSGTWLALPMMIIGVIAAGSFPLAMMSWLLYFWSRKRAIYG